MSEIFCREELILGADAMERLKAARVAVIGLGGVGSWCAEALCRSGVGTIVVYDPDSVSESNINRQLIATGATVGMPKAKLMKNRLREINQDVTAIGIPRRYEHCNREELLEIHFDYIADCIDIVTDKLDLIEYALSSGIPIISALGTGNKSCAQELRIADISETEACPLARVIRKELRGRGIEHLDCVYSPEPPLSPLTREAPPPGRRSVPGSLVWVTATAGMLMCEHIIKGLLGDNFPKGSQ